MANEQNIGRVWDLVEKVRICMLSTLEGDSIRARPMTAHLERDEQVLYFLSAAESPKDEDIAANPNVGLAFADTDGQNYVSISGQAEITNDREKVKELWSTPAKAWWDSPDDPVIRVLKITPSDAHFWDAPGTAGSYIKMLAAAAEGSQVELGGRGKANL